MPLQDSEKYFDMNRRRPLERGEKIYILSVYPSILAMVGLVNFLVYGHAMIHVVAYPVATLLMITLVWQIQIRTR